MSNSLCLFVCCIMFAIMPLLQTRTVAGASADILKVLDWAGLDYDEGALTSYMCVSSSLIIINVSALGTSCVCICVFICVYVY